MCQQIDHNHLRRAAARAQGAVAVLLGILCAGPGAAFAATDAEIAASRARGLAWLYQVQHGDGAWQSGDGNLKVQSTTAVLDALLRFGIRSGQNFSYGTAFVENARVSSTDARSRQLVSLHGSGRRIDAFSSALVAMASPNLGWGALPGYTASAIDTALASTALSKVSASYLTPAVATTLACDVLGATQEADGGWSFAATPQLNLQRPASTNIVPTAYAVLALKRLSTQVTTCASLGVPVSTLISRGITYLKSKGNADGGVGEPSTPNSSTRVSNVVDSAIAASAIAAVDAADASLGGLRNYLVSTQSTQPADAGSWGGDAFRTALVLQAFPAATLASTAGDGVPDEVKVVLGLDPAVPVRLGEGNGLGVVGTTRTVLLSATRGDPFGFNLADDPSAGNLYSLVTGGLPDGVLLCDQGTLTGTPTVAGNFSFTVRQQSSAAADTNLQIGVVVSAKRTASSITLAADRVVSNRSTTPASFTATVTGNWPTGRVTFYDGSVLVGDAWLYEGDTNATATTGVYRFTATLRGGFPWITARYEGNDNNLESTSTKVRQVVNPEAISVIRLLLD